MIIGRAGDAINATRAQRVMQSLRDTFLFSEP